MADVTAMTQTNYGEMDLVIDDRGHARRVRGGVERHTELGRDGKHRPSMRENSSRPKNSPQNYRAGANPAPSPYSPYANKWELNYANYLDLQQKAGEILSWRYGRVTFRLANGQYHRIDFIVLRKDLRIQMDQIKGWHPNLRAAIKGLKWAAQLWPMFYWTITKWNGSGWETVEVEI